MKNKKNDRCPNTALFAIPWGGKILMSCHIHGNAMAALGNAMGSPVEARSIQPGTQNCEHPNDLEMYEAAKEKTDAK